MLTIAVGLVWLSVKDMSKEDVTSAFKRANYFWIALAFIACILSHVSRAMRWQMMMKPMGYKLSFKNSFLSIMVGYLANLGLPRAGEISRSTIVAKYEKIPFQTALGTVVTDRIIDTLSLLVVMCLALIFQFNEFYKLLNEQIFQPAFAKIIALSNSPKILTALAVLFILVSLGLFLFREKIKVFFNTKVGGLIKGFGEGLASVRNVKSFWIFLFHSVFIWTMYFLGIYFCFFCLPETSHLGFKACLALLLCGTFGVIFTPGGLGAYHGIIAAILISTYGIDTNIAKIFPWLPWGTGFVAIILFGFASLILLPFVNREKNATA